MPLVRKIVQVGDSRAVVLPKSWLDFLERKHGKVSEVTMEVNGQITIAPIFKKDVASFEVQLKQKESEKQVQK